jgi:hypothetical protein
MPATTSTYPLASLRPPNERSSTFLRRWPVRILAFPRSLSKTGSRIVWPGKAKNGSGSNLNLSQKTFAHLRFGAWLRRSQGSRFFAQRFALANGQRANGGTSQLLNAVRLRESCWAQGSLVDISNFVRFRLGGWAVSNQLLLN